MKLPIPIQHLSAPRRGCSAISFIAIYAGSGLIFFGMIAAIYHLFN